MNYTDIIIQFIKDTQWENLPEPVRHQSKGNKMLHIAILHGIVV